jgi:hypothetical protein
MTWAVLLFSAVMALWTVVGGGAVSLILWAVVLIPLGLIWFMTRALRRQGRGMRLRPLRSVEIPWRWTAEKPVGS